MAPAKARFSDGVRPAWLGGAERVEARSLWGRLSGLPPLVG